MIVTREPCANGSRPFRESEAAILKPQEAGREKSWPVFLYVVWAGVPEAQYRFCKPYLWAAAMFGVFESAFTAMSSADRRSRKHGSDTRPAETGPE